MEVPDMFKNLSVDDEPKLAFISTLLDDQRCGVIVKAIAFFDDHLLKEVLLAYSRNAGGATGYTEAGVPKMPFAKKISTLESLPLGAGAVEMRDQAVTKMKPMRGLRNEAAHKSGLRRAEAETLWADADRRYLLADFPTNFKVECSAVQSALEGLLALPDFASGE